MLNAKGLGAFLISSVVPDFDGLNGSQIRQRTMNIFIFFQQQPQRICKTFNVMKTTSRFLLLLLAYTSCLQSQGQQTKTPLQLADQYFAEGEYYTAAHLYEQYLNPARDQKAVHNFPLNTLGKRRGVTPKGLTRIDVLYKQAESYRLANYFQKAANCYKECAEKNPARYSNALYWFAVCERSLGNYRSAKESLQRYLKTAGTNNQYKEAIEKELQTLSYIQQQLARPDSVLIHTQKLNSPNGAEKGVFAAVHISDNKFLVSSTQRDSIIINGANPNHSRIFHATLNNGNLEEMAAVPLSPSEPMNNLGAASISADGNYLYFSEWKKEKGSTISSIYYSVKQNGGWSLPTLLQSISGNGHNNKQPFCSIDGKYLFFASDRPNGFGQFDIWYAPIQEDGTTGEPVNAGQVINTSGDEQAPFYHNSSTTLVFSSNGRPGMGGYDLFAAKGKETTWRSPENMGHPINSSRDDIYFFAQEKTSLLSNAIFSSDRGEGCCLESYSITKAGKNKILTGILRDCSDNTPVADAEIILQDASQKTWKATTGADGKYVFDLKSSSYQDLTVMIKKELYKDTATFFTIENIDESDYLSDKLTTTDLCFEKTPVIPVDTIAVIQPGDLIPVIKAEDVVTLYFDFNKSILNSSSVNRLDSIYNVMVENPTATIQISGYTDGLGTNEYNNKLSDKRARACANYMLQKGIPPARITFVSFGACCPVEMEIINGRDNSDGRSRNRRALINIKKE